MSLSVGEAKGGAIRVPGTAEGLAQEGPALDAASLDTLGWAVTLLS